MTLELADRSITSLVGIAEDVYVKVGSFHFPADFVVVDFDADPRVPLILGRSFLKTGKALIDMFEGELTLRVGKEAITLNLDQTSRYSANYNDMTAKRIDVIDVALEAYSDSDYAGSHGDRKSTTGRCQFLGQRLISWQCKKQTVVAISSTKAEYVAVASCCGQVSNAASCTGTPACSYSFMLMDLVPAFSCIIPTGIVHADGPVHYSYWLLLVYVDEFVPTGHIPAAATTIPAGNSMDAAVHAAAAPLSFIPTAADKGKAPMVDDSLPADLLFEQEYLNWDGPYMPLLAPMLVVPAAEDGADAVAAGAATAHDVLPPSVPLTHSSSSILRPFSALYPSPIREPSPVREPTPEVGPATSTRPPNLTRHTSVHEDIIEGGGDFVSSPKSNEAPQTPTAIAVGGAEDSAALTALFLMLDRCINRVTYLENKFGTTKKVLGGAVLKLVTKVKRLEGLLQQRKRRLVLFDSEGDDATPTEKDIYLEALYTLASMSLGGDSTDKADGHDAVVVPADATMPFRRRRLRKPFSKAPMVDDSLPADLLFEQEYVLKNLHDSQLRPKPTLDAPSAKRANPEVPQVHAVSSQVPASVLAASTFAADASVFAATTPEVPAAESRPTDTPIASAHGSVEHSVAASTQSSSRRRHKHMAKKRFTPIVDMADAALIKFDSNSGSDDDPLPYTPYAGWKMVPSPLGSVHAYHDMAGHTKLFTTLHELLHIVEKTDL
nr:reverse transcriptase domain-containing protein [Tanacetum cinerariifolium]